MNSERKPVIKGFCHPHTRQLVRHLRKLQASREMFQGVVPAREEDPAQLSPLALMSASHLYPQVFRRPLPDELTKHELDQLLAAAEEFAGSFENLDLPNVVDGLHQPFAERLLANLHRLQNKGRLIAREWEDDGKRVWCELTPTAFAYATHLANQVYRRNFPDTASRWHRAAWLQPVPKYKVSRLIHDSGIWIPAVLGPEDAEPCTA